MKYVALLLALSLGLSGCGVSKPRIPESIDAKEAMTVAPEALAGDMPTMDKIDTPEKAERYIKAAVTLGEIKAIWAKTEAKEDFARSVKSWTGWVIGTLAFVSVALLVVSFFVAWIPTKASFFSFGATAAVCVLRYALLRYGTLAADIAVYVSVGLTVLAALFVGAPLGITWVKRRLNKTSQLLAAKGDDPRAATALWAASVGATSESVADKRSRELKLNELSSGVK